ncbi:MAG: hypothetical protein F9K49_02805 [Caedimonadaceae bacterium]|nr:MAG: hypothetical protein F9K49_02805 [Caedimonadaceae bacterium]
MNLILQFLVVQALVFSSATIYAAHDSESEVLMQKSPMGVIEKTSRNHCDKVDLHHFESNLSFPFKLSNYGLQQVGVHAYLEDLMELGHDGCTESLNKQLGALRQELVSKLQNWREQSRQVPDSVVDFASKRDLIFEDMEKIWVFTNDIAVDGNKKDTPTSASFRRNLSKFYADVDGLLVEYAHTEDPKLRILNNTSKYVLKGIERTIITQQFLAYAVESSGQLRSVH